MCGGATSALLNQPRAHIHMATCAYITRRATQCTIRASLNHEVPMFRPIVTAVAAAATAIIMSASAFAQGIPVRVGVIPIVGAAPIFVANGQGWTKADGLDLKFTTFESGPNMIQALASGTIDVYVAGIAPLAVARTKGIDVKVVAATAIEEMVFVAAPKLAAYFAPGVSAADAFKAYRAQEGKAARLATQPPGS